MNKMFKKQLVLLAIILISACDSKDNQIFVNADSVVVSEELSNKHVTAFAEDSTGYIWIGTARGLNRYDSHNYHCYYYNTKDDTSLPSNQIICLLVDSKDRLWVGTDNGLCYYTDKDDFHRIGCNQEYPIVHQIWENEEGRIFVNMIEHLYEYDPNTDRLKLVIDRFDPMHQFVNHCFVDKGGKVWSVINNHVRCFNSKTLELEKNINTQIKPHFAYLCKNGELWLAQGHSLTIIDTGKGQVTYTGPYPFSLDGVITCIYSIDEEKSLIYTDQGLSLYNHDTHKLIKESQNGFPFQTSGHDITQMFIDSHQNLWIGFLSQGFVVKNTQKQRFDSNPYLTSQLRNQFIASMSLATDGKLWITTSRNELLRYDDTSGLSHIQTGGLFRKPLPDVLPATVKAGPNGKLWIIYNQQLLEGSVTGNTFAAYKVHSEIEHHVACLAEDKDHTIWVGTGLDVIYYKKEGESDFHPVKLGLKSMTAVLTIYPLSDGNLVCSMALNKPIHFNTQTHKVTEIGISNIANTSSLASCFTEDHNGQVWIGTWNQGVFVYHPQDGRVEQMPKLSCEEVCDIVEDSKGYIWLSTKNGLNRYSTQDSTITSFFAADGLGGNQFNQRTAVNLSSGELAFGGAHGITIFHPGFQAEKQVFPLVFEDLSLGNHRVKAGTGCMDKKLSERPEINLAYHQNSFSISFAALDYRFSGKAHYAYKLEGYNKDWVDILSNTAYFTNIPAGDYQLRVRLVKKDYISHEEENAIHISIGTAPWNSWWAWIIYLGALGTVVFVFIRGRIRIINEHRAARQLELEKEQEQRINKMNMSFFANISHEFRTPLTMISGPATLLYEDTTLDRKQQQLASTIKWNSQRMLKLVNQLMDFNRLENDALKLQVSNCDIIQVIRQTIEMFQINIQEKDISLKQYGIEDQFFVPIDPDKIDKVLTNLFSNALKFTPKGGEITCGFDADSERMTIYVSDNGVQIPENQLERIFERYYQVANHHNYGTGIGLYYCRRLLTLHHGEIHCENLKEGGVKFTVTLPAKDIYSTDEHATAPAIEQSKIYPVENLQKESKDQEEHEEKVMLVDDDPGIINYLKILLSPHYDIVYAYEAEAAIQIIRTEMPDIVLSDVAMPGKDGYQLCEEIKEDSSICHIPVILVTAKTTKDDQITGLQTGADDYITKPFDPDYLQALIRSRLDNRKRIQHIVSEATKTEDIEENVLNEQDKKFMDELYSLMERELSNSDININAITNELLISRTKLYYKVKALTGEKPNTFFKKFRLNRAAELLKSGKYNVSEVSYMTGFSSLTVFSRNFKSQFGMTPTEYIKN